MQKDIDSIVNTLYTILSMSLYNPSWLPIQRPILRRSALSIPIHRRNASLPPCSHHLILMKLHALDEKLTQGLQPRNKNAKHARNDKHANTLANLQPRPLIADFPEEAQREIISNPHDDGEERSAAKSETLCEDAEICGDEGKGREEFEDQKGALGERVEDGDEAVNGIEGEGRDGGDVAC